MEGPGGAYRLSCWLLKPLSERQSLILPLILPGVNRAQTAWTEPGQQTLPAKADRSAKLAQLRDLEAEMALVGGADPKTRDILTALSPNPFA